MKKEKTNLLLVHFAVLLFGLAGIFGKLINQSALVIVWGRVVFGALALALSLKFFKNKIRLEKSNYVKLLFTGVILAVHWWSFFYSIQISSVSIGLISFSTFPVFTTLLEPLFFSEKFSLKSFNLSLITILAMFLLVSGSDFNINSINGILFGLMSAITFAFLTILNRKYVMKIKSGQIAFYQNLFAALILTPVVFVDQVSFAMVDVLLLLLLGTVFTALAHSFFIKGLETIKAQTAAIITTLEPVYGIIAAFIILAEKPSGHEIIGGVIIIFVSSMASIKNPLRETLIDKFIK